MSIYIITDQTLYGGTGTYSLRLFELLKDVFDDVRFICVHPFTPKTIPYDESILLKFSDNFLMIPYFTHYNILELQKKGVLNHNIHFTGLQIYKFLSSDIPRLFTVHDVYRMGLKGINTLEPKNLVRGIGRELFLTNYLANLEKMSYIVTPSSFTSTMIDKKHNHKVEVIHHWVERDIFKPRNKQSMRKKLGLPVDKKILLNVGGTGINKNSKILQKIQKEMSSDFIILKIGQELKGENILNVGRVSFKDLPLYYSASDLYLHTSSIEGFGIPLIEALSSGVPTIASLKGPNLEILGKSGVYVKDSYATSEWLDAIYEINNNNKYQEISNNAILRSEMFGKDLALEKYSKLYSKVFPT